MLQTWLDLARTITTISFLLYASWSDYKTREVSNRVWIAFAPIAFALTFAEFFLSDFRLLPSYGLCFGLTAVFAIALFYLGSFGGADAKALMCLALALPFYPESLPAPLFGEVSPIAQGFFPITVFSNSVLLAAATAVYMLLHNLFWHKRLGIKLFEEHQKEPLGKKLLVLITGYKTSVSKLKEKWHLYPLEDVEENNHNGFKRKLVIMPKDEDRSAIVERLTKAVEDEKIKDMIWATPGLPMLIFITAGLIIALYFGDIVWTFVEFMLRGI